MGKLSPKNPKVEHQLNTMGSPTYVNGGPHPSLSLDLHAMDHHSTQEALQPFYPKWPVAVLVEIWLMFLHMDV